MTRVKHRYVAYKWQRFIFTLTLGFQEAHSKLFQTVNQQGMKVLASFHRDRSRWKRDFCRLWIAWINLATQGNRISYNKLIRDLYQNQVLLNRKMLAHMAILDNDYFSILYNTSLLGFPLFLFLNIMMQTMFWWVLICNVKQFHF
jgi:large subunit ribosomal protein L20